MVNKTSYSQFTPYDGWINKNNESEFSSSKMNDEAANIWQMSLDALKAVWDRASAHTNYPLNFFDTSGWTEPDESDMQPFAPGDGRNGRDIPYITNDGRGNITVQVFNGPRYSRDAAGNEVFQSTDGTTIKQNPAGQYSIWLGGPGLQTGNEGDPQFQSRLTNGNGTIETPYGTFHVQNGRIVSVQLNRGVQATFSNGRLEITNAGIPTESTTVPLNAGGLDLNQIVIHQHNGQQITMDITEGHRMTIHGGAQIGNIFLDMLEGILSTRDIVFSSEGTILRFAGDLTVSAAGALLASAEATQQQQEAVDRQSLSVANTAMSRVSSAWSKILSGTFLATDLGELAISFSDLWNVIQYCHALHLDVPGSIQAAYDRILGVWGQAQIAAGKDKTITTAGVSDPFIRQLLQGEFMTHDQLWLAARRFAARAAGAPYMMP